ncbi:glycosyl hydrolase [Pedobacter sp. P351]|uniref:glycosyl hydrolase n=1 Tax=Pedobacter superstes TaxID=3133441 RepID=UPI0030A62FB0
MQRRNFLKNTIITSAGMMFMPMLPKAVADTLSNLDEISISDLEKHFISPPESARPWVFYMWMNGNITKEGITKDLEAMKRMGIGGAICFNSAVGIPRGPVDYAKEDWMDATVHAITEAQRLGIEFNLHNSPGYSGAGGPWITPEMSMQQLVWTETLVSSRGKITRQLPRPYAKQNYYRDARVIAYPSLTAEKFLMKDRLVRVLLDGKETDKTIITDRNPETKIRLEVSNASAGSDPTAYNIGAGVFDKDSGGTGENSGRASIVLEFSEPFEARAITILRKAEVPRDLFDGPRDHPPVFLLETSHDGVDFRPIGRIASPELREMDTPTALSFNAVSAKYYRLSVTSSTWLSDIELHNGPRLGGWPGKTSNTHGTFSGDTPALGPDLIINPDTVLDISRFMNEDGRLSWKAPEGNWTILRIGHTTTGEENAAHPDAGKGLELDKFRKAALDLHFEAFLDRLLGKIKTSVRNGLKGITVDSWEAGKQNWTINFPEEFKQRKNYELMKWMPAMTGRIVGSVEDTERFLWDIRKIHADLLAENFYGHFADKCHERGLDFYAEPYGDGNFDSLQVGQHLDIMMCEFWTRYIYGSDIYSKQAVSSAHLYGKKIVAAEAFTAMPATSKWTDYPYSLKAEGDYFYTLGVNRLVFHTFVHQPYTTGLPGMTMGPFGMHIDRNNTWTEQAHAWTGYLKRSQYLLQQGLTVSDVCYFKGDVPESGVPDVYRLLPKGYSGDVCGPDALHKRFKISNGKIVLPDGMSYQLCLMAPLQAILPSSLNKIKDLVADGMVLMVSSKPSKAFGLSSKDSEVQEIVQELYGNLDGESVTERSFGKGRIIWGKPLEEVLGELSISPDFSFTSENQDAAIHYIHKTVGDIEFYFVSNHRRRKESIVCSFRLSGKQPEIWSSDNGSSYEAGIYETSDGRTILPLEMEPAGSCFIVFRKNAKPAYNALLKDGKEVLSVAPFKEPDADKYRDVQNAFTVAVWAKPDTFAHNGRSMLFHPPAGEEVYGKGHAAFGLSAGQNAVRVYERSTGAREVLSYSKPLSGWTHIAVVYQNAKPSLFINGKSASTGTPSAFIVHPGLETIVVQDHFTSFFEGNHTKPELFTKALSRAEIEALFRKGLPDSINTPSASVAVNPNGKLKALFWSNGKYALKGPNSVTEIGLITQCNSRSISGSWKVQFPKGTGAPAEITLSELISLKDHPDFNVKHFSGTASYFKIMMLSADDLQAGKRLFLDLGRVEVIAELKINGKEVDVLWKEPFIADITDAVKRGPNQLEIKVTNLWQNRLIGDEHLPVEHEYSEHRFIKKLPDWYVNNQPKPGERIGFAVWKNFDKDSPLLESGLLGPLRLLIAAEKLI